MDNVDVKIQKLEDELYILKCKLTNIEEFLNRVESIGYEVTTLKTEIQVLKDGGNI